MPPVAATLEFREATKRYPGADAPAVDGLSLTVEAGEICVLVGPSGCGKTTAMRMVNRMIDMTSGDILLGERSVNARKPSELRRDIGYVIQQVGLFPHRTIAENIATVPGLLGWDKPRIAARVDELLELVGLPEEMRNRFPSHLSGGQQQRVGVARGLAADPAVMLMDEPFGAIDPITREKIQEEFLEIQRQVAKTICFVTHDLSEAVKLGDRIAVFGPGGVVEQYDTPEQVLTHPANDFVAEFVGSGAAVRRLSLLQLNRLELDEVTVAGSGPLNGRPTYRADDSGRAVAWAHLPGADATDLPRLVTVPLTGTVYDAVDVMLESRTPLVAVVDDEERPQGALRWEALVGELPT